MEDRREIAAGHRSVVTGREYWCAPVIKNCRHTVFTGWYWRLQTSRQWGGWGLYQPTVWRWMSVRWPSLGVKEQRVERKIVILGHGNTKKFPSMDQANSCPICAEIADFMCVSKRHAQWDCSDYVRMKTLKPGTRAIRWAVQGGNPSEELNTSHYYISMYSSSASVHMLTLANMDAKFLRVVLHCPEKRTWLIFEVACFFREFNKMHLVSNDTNC